MVLMREEITDPEKFEAKALQTLEDSGYEEPSPKTLKDETTKTPSGSYNIPGRSQSGPPIGTFRKTPGVVEFP